MSVELARHTDVLLCVVMKSRYELPEDGNSAETCRS